MIDKSGIAYAAFGKRLPNDTNMLNAKYLHTWHVRPPANVPASMEWTPFLSCDCFPVPAAYGDLVTHDNFAISKALYPPHYAGHFLFLNEPDQYTQCKRQPFQAAAMYKALITMLPQAKVIGPNLSQYDYEGKVKWSVQGKDDKTPAKWWWHVKFYNQLKEQGIPLPYGVGLHWYPFTDTSINGMVTSFLTTMRHLFDYSPRIWITEFACRNARELSNTINYFRYNYQIDRYYYYSPRWGENNAGGMTLFNNATDYGLTEVGKEWVRQHGT